MERLYSQLYTYAVFAFIIIFAVGCGSAFDADNTITVNGTVTELGSSEPLDSVNVRITSPTSLAAKTTSDSLGIYQFTIDTEEAVALEIVASKNNFKDTLRTVPQAEPGEDYSNINLSLAKADSIGDDAEDNNGEDSVEGKGAASIVLAGDVISPINIAETGDNVQSPIAFQVIDSAGNPLTKQKAVKVKFELVSSPGGNEQLLHEQVTTNKEGIAATTLLSGNKNGIVKVQAIVEQEEMGFPMKSSPVKIAIHGGFPFEKNFELSSSVKNVDISDAENLPVINVDLGDQFSNPVAPGTAISFQTNGEDGREAGIIQGSASTDEDGKASVSFTSLRPRSSNGKVVVTATTVGEDDQKISKNVNLIFSTPTAKIVASTTDFELKQGASRSFDYSVTDENGNPMAASTQINVNVEDEGLEVSGDTDVTVGDHLQGGPSKTDFQFNLLDTGESEKENISVTITVTSPSGKTTEYTGISGTRVIEGNDRVGAAAIVLTQEPKDFININETGDEVSAPLTFQVRDSLGRPIAANEAVEVEFRIVSGPGGAEDLVPAKATTDGSGNVTTTLFSGNEAGEVKVEALVRRPEVGLIVRSSPVLIAIHGGFPDQAHFTISRDVTNFEGLNTVRAENEISVLVGDKFSNPVKPGTVIYFESTAGVIDGSAKTDEKGRASVVLQSGNPLPATGVGTVTASTRDKLGNFVGGSIDVIFSGSKASISSNPTTFNIPNGGGETFTYTVQDVNNYAMAVGTQISIDAGEGIELTGDTNFTISNYDKISEGPKDFSFTIRDTDTENDIESDLTLKISVTTPVTGQTTTYTINGTRN